MFEIHLKALVVGYGSIGKRHIANLSSITDIEIIVYTKRKTDKFLREKGCKVLHTIKKCIEEEPQIALITNVTSYHVKIATKLANAGINLFIEKPLSNSLRGVETLLKTARKRKLITLMGCNLRFHPCIKKIKEIISRRYIGKIISVHVENGSFLPNWHLYEDYRESYAARKDLGGGVVLTNIHEIDYLFWFFGKVKEVFSFTGKYSDLKLDTDDLSTALLRFGNDVIAEVHLDYFQRPDFRSCKIIGTKGTIYWDSEINAVKVYDIKKEKWIEKLRVKNYDNNSTYIEEILHFLKCVKKKKRTINSINEGAKVLEIALATKRSSKIKKVVTLS